MAVRLLNQNLDFSRITPEQIRLKLDEMNKNPLEHYRNLTMLLETYNPISGSESGLKYLRELRNGLNVTPEQIEQIYQPPELNEQSNQMITGLDNQRLETAYKNVFNDYTYGENVAIKPQQRQILGIFRQELSRRNINADELIRNKTPISRIFEFLGNVFSLPSNAVGSVASKVVTGEWGKLWGGNAWEDLFRDVGQDKDPEVKKIIQKDIENIPLTPDEEKRIKEFDTRNMWLGLAASIITDPTLYINPISKIGNLSKLANMRVAGEVGNVIKNNAKIAESIIKNLAIEGAEQSIGKLDDILKLTKIIKPEEITRSMTTLSEVARALPPQVPEVRALLEGIQKSDSWIKAVFSAEQKMQRPAYKAIEEFNKKARNVYQNALEKSGIRKAFVSDVPIEAKAVVDKARQINTYYIEEINKVQLKAKEAFNKLAPEISDYLRANPRVSAMDVFSEMVEQPKSIVKFVKKDVADKVYNEVIKPVSESFNDMIIWEVKHGVTTVPLDIGTDITKWDTLANKYYKLIKKNEYHPDVGKIEKELRDMLDSGNVKFELLNPSDAIDEINDINYLTHSMTPEAKEYFLKLPKNEQGEFIKTYRTEIEQLRNTNIPHKYRSSASHVSQKQRGLRGTMMYFNELGEQGKMLPGFNGKIFDTDINKLISIRGSRMARSIQNAELSDGLAQFLRPAKESADFVKLNDKNIPAVFRGKWAHKDIASLIEKTWSVMDNNSVMKQLLNFINNATSVWKSFTLGFHPTTSIRNEIGNFFNMWLSLGTIQETPAMLASFKDAVLGLGNQSYKLVSKSGKVMEITDIMEEAAKRGIFGTRWQTVEATGEGIARKITGAIQSGSPASRLNQWFEESSRLAMFIDGFKRGMSFDEAATRTFKYLFDYSDVPEFFKKYVRIAIPFATWARKNIPLQLSHLMSIPSRIMVKTEQALTKDRYGSVDERFMSDWMKNMAKIPLRGNDNRYFLLEGFIPYYDVDRVIRVIGADNKLKGLINEIAKDLSPMIKLPIELATNKDLTFGGDVQQSRYATKEMLGFRMTPSLARILQNVRLISTAEKMGAGEALSHITGQTYSNPTSKDFLRGLFGFLFAASTPYNVGFSRALNRSKELSEISAELNNFSRWMENLKIASVSGHAITDKDRQDIIDRASQNTYDIEAAYADGKITREERDKLLKRIANLFIEGRI